jgi:hypothetical protein
MIEKSIRLWKGIHENGLAGLEKNGSSVKMGHGF